MITHYDIKVETQRLKQVLTDEGVNIPSLFQVIKPGLCVFMWVLLWPTIIQYLLYHNSVRYSYVDIFISGMMGLILFVVITNGMMLFLSIPETFRKDSKMALFMYSKARCYVFSFLFVFSLISFMHSFLYVFALIITYALFFLFYLIDINRYKLSGVIAVIESLKKEPVS
ncbi:conjugal transfer entry exclusion protein TraS [Escherichia coli]|nr:conjugal transfer entry exclusion protein TraS [Escherichia coli]EJD7275388.1 conjugal transfer entry exclusion protein TraS [Escherichia coli]